MDAPNGQAPNPASYHLTNLLLHVVASVLVFFFAATLGVSPLSSAGAATLFAVHPVTAQAVAWIPGRCDGFVAVFSLGALLAWMRFDGRGSRKALAAHHGLLAAGLFSKESAIAVPVVALCYSLFVTRRVSRARDVFVWAGWSLAIAAWYFARRSAVGALDTATTAKAFFRNAPALVVGFGKLLVPVELDVLATLRDSSLLPGGVAIALLALGAIVVPRDKRWLFVWTTVALPLAFLIPALGVSDFLILDNRLYVPMAGVAVGAAIAWERWLASRPKSTASWAALALAGVALATRTYERVSLFDSPSAFCEAAVEGSPHLALAYLNRGAVKFREGRLGDAQRDFERAIAENPREPVAHNDLGLVYLNSAELGRAEGEFKAELAHNPNYSKAHFNLGLVYERTGRPELAKDQFEMVVALLPTDADAWGELFKYWAPRDAARAEAIQKKMEALGVRFFTPQ
jgi:tetratricopeptide (TPR) repeat protein